MAKTVLIIGGGRGIGCVTAMRSLADGYHVGFTFGALDAPINNAGTRRDALGCAFSMIHATLPVMMKQRRVDGDVKRNLIHEVLMRPADRAAAGIAFLISDDSSAITGQVLPIDGGVSA
jgi:NAD(P)-dependent dehydrogenase (short-subunit alcohol dehydrogenase family)